MFLSARASGSKTPHVHLSEAKVLSEIAFLNVGIPVGEGPLVSPGCRISTADGCVSTVPQICTGEGSHSPCDISKTMLCFQSFLLKCSAVHCYYWVKVTQLLYNEILCGSVKGIYKIQT